MKYFILLFLIGLLSYNSNGQNVLKGKVSTPQGNSIPGVRVYVENTSYGVITNIKGEYFIELKQNKPYSIVFKMIGMQDTAVLIQLKNKITTINMILSEYTEELNTVEVKSKKIDIAKRVIKSVQKNRKQFYNQYTNYTCNSYVKTGLEKILDPKKLIKRDTIDSIISGPSKMNFIESFALTSFQSPNKYHEEILAQHDYAEKVNQNFSASVNIKFENEIAPTQRIEHNPYIFYEKIQDGDFNLYQNMINLPKITEHPIVSPIGMNAFINYNFSVKNIFYENDQKIYEIMVKPKFSAAPLFSGTLFIIDGKWIVKSFELKLPKSTMPFFNDFTVIHDYVEEKNKIVVNRREYSYTIKEGQYIISANTRVNHSNYTFDTTINGDKFKNELLTYHYNAYNKDSTYWANTRPIQLKTSELNFIKAQDSIDNFLKSEAYLDSIDAEFNKIKFWDITLQGIGFRNRFKQQEIMISSLMSSFNVFGVGGLRIGPSGSYSKKFDNAKKITVNTKIDYGINNKDIKGNLGISYTYLPKKFGTISVSGGNEFDLITNYNSALGTFSRGNYVQKKHITLKQNIELTNGLYGLFRLSYSDRQGISNLKLAEWSTVLFGELNKPKPFKQYTTALIEVKLLYRFKQKYIIKNNEKIIIGTKFPELELTYTRGIPKLLNSEINFDFIEIKASDEINLGNYGDSKWNFITGSFFNAVDLRFLEHKFFRGSDGYFFSNPLRSHQRLDSTFHTPSPYLQAFYTHHFNGLIMNKIPLIKHLKLELMAGASTLIIQDANYLHAELFAGLEKKFKIRKQYFKFGVFGATRVNTSDPASIRLKLGFDFFKSYTNTWSY